jgi:hypothetical protein
LGGGRKSVDSKKEGASTREPRGEKVTSDRGIGAGGGGSREREDVAIGEPEGPEGPRESEEPGGGGPEEPEGPEGSRESEEPGGGGPEEPEGPEGPRESEEPGGGGPEEPEEGAGLLEGAERPDGDAGRDWKRGVESRVSSAPGDRNTGEPKEGREAAEKS